MSNEVLAVYMSKIAGRNARVTLTRRTLEWESRKSLLVRGDRKMIPLRSITSVSILRDAFKRIVRVETPTETIDLRMRKTDAEVAKEAILDAAWASSRMGVPGRE